jgi:hypothetical protein
MKINRYGNVQNPVSFACVADTEGIAVAQVQPVMDD